MNRNSLATLRKWLLLLGASTTGLLFLAPAKAQVNPQPTIFNEPPFNGAINGTTGNSTSPSMQTPAPSMGSGMEAPTTPDTTLPETSPETPGMGSELEMPVTPETSPPTMDGTEMPATPETPSPGMGSGEMEMPNTPDDPSQSQSNATITEIASSSESFQTLTAALEATGLADALAGQGPFTVFAPTDEAFAALPPGIVEELMKPENRAALTQILAYHVVPGAVLSSDLTSGEVSTEAGSAVMIQVDNNNRVMVNDASVIQPDIPASNGVIHVIDRVILPPNL
jgi:uncharacterized surface protein with fasciclin (FAS1) repeats